LKRQGFPKDEFQLLCSNCNQAKHRYGQCPHHTLEGAC
jgi:predicted HNH restriction endonuclease